MLLRTLGYWSVVPLIILIQLAYLGRKKNLLVWGPDPIINNKYWSEAMKEAGWSSVTLMATYYSAINRREDYDLYFENLVSGVRPALLARELAPIFAHLYIARHAAVVHIPFFGGALGKTPIWRLEAFFYRLAGVKTVVLPYGADAFMYSQIQDLGVRHALLLSYPAAARDEARIAKRVHYWVRRADVVVVGYTPDGIGRWDVAPLNKVCIDSSLWKTKTTYSDKDGRNGAVRIMHAPNHRGTKGTEFLVEAVEQLRREGLTVDLVLAERRQNEEIRAMMQDVDVLADQFLLPGYGLAAIEGMASGLPVMANLGSESYTRVFRRWSFLDECPILTVSPESLVENLRLLITNPELRRQLGQAGRAYIEKYHSYAAAQYLFGSIYRKILGGEDVDLMNLFHPIKSEYVRSHFKVTHPLVENRLPSDSALRC